MISVDSLESILNEISARTKRRFTAFGEVELFRLHNGKWRCHSDGFRASGDSPAEAATAVLMKIKEANNENKL